MPSPIAAAAALFPAASAELMGDRQLLRRVDTKYVCTVAEAARFVDALVGHYAALPTPGGNLATYRSLYFDTPDLRCYHDHRRGKRLRQKVRIRHYPERQLSFLEVKTKMNEATTDKLRRPLTFGEEQLGPDELAYLGRLLNFDALALRPMLRIDFRRLSLVGLETAERVTIDCDLMARDVEGPAAWSGGDRIVVEVKQSPFCVRTPVMRALHAGHFREQSMSKYTIATALIRDVRRNRLLPDLRAIERMSA
jgi:hypothetical protein